MQWLQDKLNTLSSIIWGEFLLIPLLAIVGIYLTIGLYAMPWRKIPLAFKTLWQGRKESSHIEGDITPFQALMTALSATVGTGNIAGVATAIYFGGPGAIFWMWVIALFGMATKYAEAVLAVSYRQTDDLGNYVGGPMYYIHNGLGDSWRWMAASFAFFAMIAAFGIGNMVQSHSVADEIYSSFDIPVWITGIVMATLAALVIVGGVKRIAQVAAKLVPFMALAYILAALTIVILNISKLPDAISLIFHSAFNGSAASGGFLGATIWMAIRWGFARGIFSNEAGLGSAPIAHAAAQTNDPVKQGMVAMLGTFIDTIIICSLTAFVIILTGTWDSGLKGVSMSSQAFSTGLFGYGGYIVSFGLVLFAFTTILGWSYYGERSAEYLFGTKIIRPYRLLWICAIFIGAIMKLELVWTFADILNGLMALPNLVALLLLSPVVFSKTRQYFNNKSSTW
ncbi:MAG: sodium:alanine symporter family protein [Proteobacteria bacterium]|nr:sodium:alanine symporter family protein [Pseudomonadota bacterium]NOG61608.1 sodium:alanine symporter family protein [Pseudomonadota bacterium]